MKLRLSKWLLGLLTDDGWIPTRYCNPAPEQPVLFYRHDTGQVVRGHRNRTGLWFDSSDHHHVSVLPPTHWMPLPEAPKIGY